MSKHNANEKKAKAARAKQRKRAKVAAAEPVVTTPEPLVLDAVTTTQREERNGVKRPRAGGLCAAVWEALDQMHAAGVVPTTKDVRDLATVKDWNQNNAMAELSAWRKFIGLSKPQQSKRGPRHKAQTKLAASATRVDGTVDEYVS